MKKQQLRVEIEQLEYVVGESKTTKWNQQLNRPGKMMLPKATDQYTFGKSSRGKKVLIPLWVIIEGIRYDKMETFPFTSISAHAGAHGCVAAYQSSEENFAPFARRLKRIALKCVPFGPKRKASSSPWASEWLIHDYLSKSACSQEAYVRCIAGASLKLQRTCQVFFALELMDTDLFSMIERAPKMPDYGNWILNAFLSTARALHGLHNTGVVYCDLKPENVLVNTVNGQCKFGDFDRSCVPGLNLGVVGGTKGYYSPERMENLSLHTIGDDVWAFGVLILIGCTTAASPYLDYRPENVHKFIPSKYLKHYSRCGWSKAVTETVGGLCDRLLCVDAAKRASLSFAIKILEGLLHLSSSTHIPVVSIENQNTFSTCSPIDYQQALVRLEEESQVYQTPADPGSSRLTPIVIDDDDTDCAQGDSAVENHHPHEGPDHIRGTSTPSITSMRVHHPLERYYNVDLEQTFSDEDDEGFFSSYSTSTSWGRQSISSPLIALQHQSNETYALHENTTTPTTSFDGGYCFLNSQFDYPTSFPSFQTFACSPPLEQHPAKRQREDEAFLQVMNKRPLFL